MSDEDAVYIVIQIRDKNKARAVSMIRNAIHEVADQRNIAQSDTVVYSEGRGRADGEVWYGHSTWEVIDNTYRFIMERARALADSPMPKWGRRGRG